MEIIRIEETLKYKLSISPINAKHSAVSRQSNTEKLISDAVLYGDKHKHTMEMAQWWLENVSCQ